MERRDFFKATAGIIVCASSQSLFADNLEANDKNVRDSLSIQKQMEKDFYVTPSELLKISNLNKKLKEVRRIVGYGRFNLIGLDEAILYAKRYSKIGKFSKSELNLLEKMFYHSAHDYGFYGEKVLLNITDKINKRDTVKISRTGHYLFKGKPVHMYEKIVHEIGRKNVTLTSGVRGVIKQSQLFLSKVVDTKGNISLASRSLAPPGYSFHGVGDFDIGKVGFGYRNFTADFAKTDECKKLMDLGYIDIRYPVKNPFGVRYEPWHIKIV